MSLGVRIYRAVVFGNDYPLVNVTRSPPEAHMKRILAKFVADEAGATAIEYGLIAAGISIVILAAVNGLGSNLNTKFTTINSSLK